MTRAAPHPPRQIITAHTRAIASLSDVLSGPPAVRVGATEQEAW